MIDYEYHRVGSVNVALLHEEMKAEFGELCAGVSTRYQTIIVHVDESVDRVAVQAVLDAHDPRTRTAEQTRREGLLQRVSAGRGQPDIDVDDFRGSPQLLALAEKIAWLEAEMRLLRGD